MATAILASAKRPAASPERRHSRGFPVVAAHESNRLRPGRKRRDALRFQRLLELAPFGIGERGLTRFADRFRAGGAGDRVALDHGVHDAQEIAFAALVRFAVALDQARAQSDLEREARVAL